MLSWFNMSRLARRSGFISPNAKLPAGEAAIKEAITCRDAEAVREKLGKTGLSPEAWQVLLTQAFEQRSSRFIKKALLQHPACVPQFALELAIRHNDIFIAARALRQGADPENIATGSATDGMRTLLTRARRKNPQHASHAQNPDLNRALRNIPSHNALREASRFAHQAVQEKTVQSAWQDAVKENRFNIQRAMHLFYAETNRNFRLSQEDAVTDEVRARERREAPYSVSKGGLPKNSNGTAMYLGKNEETLDRPFVEHRQEVQEQSSLDDAQYARKKTIAARAFYDRHANPASGAVENGMLASGIENKKIGAAVLLLGVVALFFYMLLNGFAGDWKRLKNAMANRSEREQMRLPTTKNADEVSEFHSALEPGHADTIKAFGKLLELVPSEKRAELLAAKNADGVPGLYTVWGNGHADAIKAFGELLKLVPPEERAALLKGVKKRQALKAPGSVEGLTPSP